MQTEFGPGYIGFETDEDGSAQQAYERHELTRAQGISIDHSKTLDEYSQEYAETIGSTGTNSFTNDYDNFRSNSDGEDGFNQNTSLSTNQTVGSNPSLTIITKEELEQLAADLPTPSPHPPSTTGGTNSETENEVLDFVDATLSIHSFGPLAGVVDVIKVTAQNVYNIVGDAFQESYTGGAFRMGVIEVQSNAERINGFPSDLQSYEAHRSFISGVRNYVEGMNIPSSKIPLPVGYVDAMKLTNPHLKDASYNLSFTSAIDEKWANNELTVYAPSSLGGGVFSESVPSDILTYGAVSSTTHVGQNNSLIVLGHTDTLNETYSQSYNFLGLQISANRESSGQYIAAGGVAFIPDSTSNLTSKKRFEVGAEELHHAGVAALTKFASAGLTLSRTGKMSFSSEQIAAMERVQELSLEFDQYPLLDSNGNFNQFNYVHNHKEVAARTAILSDVEHQAEVQERLGLPDRSAEIITRNLRSIGEDINRAFDHMAQVFTQDELNQIEREFIQNR